VGVAGYTWPLDRIWDGDGEKTLTDNLPALFTVHSERRAPAPYKLPWVGRYTVEVAERVCDEVASGRTLERIAIEEIWAPSHRQLYYWLVENPEFKEAYEIARDLRAEKLANDILPVAYDRSLDPDERKVIIHAHQWLASKMNRRAWGEHKTVDTNATVEVKSTNTIDVSHMSLDEIHAAERAFVKMIDVTPEDGDEDEG
jgi:hypothetical protein